MIIAVLTYKKELPEVDKYLEAHQLYLDENYSAGKFVASGPRIPRMGGVILIKTTKEEASLLIEKDPFFLNGIAHYELIEFNPNKFGIGLEQFIGDIKKASACNNLDEVRSGIDSIDNSIVGLIAQRAEYVKAAANFKQSVQLVQDTHRVEKVIESKKELAVKFGVSAELIATIYREMINYFVEEETKIWKKKQESEV